MERDHHQVRQGNYRLTSRHRGLGSRTVSLHPLIESSEGFVQKLLFVPLPFTWVDHSRRVNQLEVNYGTLLGIFAIFPFEINPWHLLLCRQSIEFWIIYMVWFGQATSFYGLWCIFEGCIAL